MRRTLILAAAILSMLTAGAGRSRANGILVVPLEVYKWTPVAAARPAPSGEWRLYSDGVWRYVWYEAPAVQYQWVKVSAYALVPNPIRPCYKPPPPPPPSKAAPTASPQMPQALPSGDAKDAHEGHEHGEDSPKEGCGSCFPECFLKLPCTCCAHDVEVLPALSPAALYYWNAVDKQLIAFRIISSYKRNADGTYTFEP